VGEATDGVDGLLGEILLSHARLVITLGSNAKNALVLFSAVEVTILTCTGYGGSNASRMP